MTDIAEVRAALKRAQDAIILSDQVLALDAIDAALDALRVLKGKRWKHVKRGIVVTEIGRGFVQAATGPLFEMSPVVFYRHDEDGSLWVRHVEEFGDGRFVEVDGVRWEGSNIAEEIAERLLQMAARRSVETCFGWTHPDCQLIQQAANLLRQESGSFRDSEDRVTTAPNELPTPLKEIIRE